MEISSNRVTMNASHPHQSNTCFSYHRRLQHRATVNLARFDFRFTHQTSRFRCSFIAICWLSLLLPCATLDASTKPPPGFVALFNGTDFTGWKVPEADNGHWKINGEVIDYDAQSEGKGDKSLWTEREFGDFALQVDWRIKETPYVNPNVYYI